MPSKCWPSWVNTCIAIAAFVVAGVLVVGVVRRAGQCGDEVGVKVYILAENELKVGHWGVFVDDRDAHLAAREVMVHGWDETGAEVRVLVSSVDNITVEYHTDGKDFVTIKLIGYVANGVAEGAVILVPTDDNHGYYERVRREVHAMHSAYANCPRCNPGKK